MEAPLCQTKIQVQVPIVIRSYLRITELVQTFKEYAHRVILSDIAQRQWVTLVFLKIGCHELNPEKK